MLDLLAFSLCIAVWLGPLLYNLGRGHLRLLHPIGFLPIMVMLKLISPLIYRLSGEPILQTSLSWSNDLWFLAEPMLVLAASGIFYHLGVRLGGTSLVLGPEDRVETFLNFKVRENIPDGMLFCIVCSVLILAVLAHRFTPLEDYSKGYYWLRLFFRSFIVLPILVSQHNRKLGSLFFVMCAPAALLMHSKVSFLYFLIAFVVFYQQKLLQISKSTVVALLFLILLTPTTVEVYRSWEPETPIAQVPEVGTKETGKQSWSDTLDTIMRREYAFEAFAVVYHRRSDGEPWHWGNKTMQEFMLCIPHFFWPDKPLSYSFFPAEYLPNDYYALDIIYTPHTLTNFFLDFDVFGACLGMLLLGGIFGFSYRTALRATLRRQEIWPLVIFLNFQLFAQYFVESNIFLGLVYVIGASCGVMLVVAISVVLTPIIKRKTPQVTSMELNRGMRDRWPRKSL